MKELQEDVENFDFSDNGEYSDDDYSDTESKTLNIFIEIEVKICCKKIQTNLFNNNAE